jgi:hypothetical protein
VPLFGRSRDEDAAPPVAAAPEVIDPEVERLATLPTLELAEEILRIGFGDSSPLPASSPQVTGASRTAVGLVDAYVVARGNTLLGSRNVVLAHVREAVHALLIARLVVRLYGRDPEWFVISRDGRAALDRGDVAEVLARRLPD